MTFTSSHGGCYAPTVLEHTAPLCGGRKHKQRFRSLNGWCPAVAYNYALNDPRSKGMAFFRTVNRK